MTLLRTLSSDWLKTKKTPIRILLFAAPILLSFAIVWYFSNFAKTQQLQLNIHEAFFQVGTIFLPMAAGLFSGLLCAQEEHAGNFIGMMTEPVSRTKIYLSKLLLLFLLLVGWIFGSIGLLLLGLKFVLQIDPISMSLFLKSGLLAAAGLLPLCAIYLFLAMAYGLGASVGVGGAGLLVAAIVGTTTIGDSVWQFVPWAWPVRLAWAPVIFMPGITMPKQMVPSEFYAQQLQSGLIPAILLFLILTIFSIVWFARWEGQKSYD